MSWGNIQSLVESIDRQAEIWIDCSSNIILVQFSVVVGINNHHIKRTIVVTINEHSGMAINLCITDVTNRTIVEYDILLDAENFDLKAFAVSTAILVTTILVTTILVATILVTAILMATILTIAMFSVLTIAVLCDFAIAAVGIATVLLLSGMIGCLVRSSHSISRKLSLLFWAHLVPFAAVVGSVNTTVPYESATCTYLMTGCCKSLAETHVVVHAGSHWDVGVMNCGIGVIVSILILIFLFVLIGILGNNLMDSLSCEGRSGSECYT